MSSIHFIGQCFHWSTRYSRWLKPVADLALRLYLARLFFQAALEKIQHWPETLALFQGEYTVPWLAPPVAAILLTSIELVVPVFIGLGLGARIPAMVLFGFHALMSYSTPALWADSGSCMIQEALYLSMLIGILWAHGPGKLSLDYLLVRQET